MVASTQGGRNPASGSPAQESLGGRWTASLAQQAKQFASGALVPGTRIGGRCVAADATRFDPLSGGLQLGDPVQDRPIQCGQFLGRGMRVHEDHDGGHGRGRE